MALTLSEVRISYSSERAPVLIIGALEFGSGINFVVGANGSGKSTLLKALSGIYHDDISLEGNVMLDGSPLGPLRPGIVGQNPLTSINVDLTFQENLVLACTSGYQHLSLKPQVNRERADQTRRFLDRFQNGTLPPELLLREAAKLSSGQQQILAILMRSIRLQRLLLLDEATANLDGDNVGVVMSIVQAIADSGAIVIFATHQTELLNRHGSAVFQISDKEVSLWKRGKA